MKMTPEEHADAAEDLLSRGFRHDASIHAQLACYGMQKAAVDLVMKVTTPPTEEDLREHFARVEAARRPVDSETTPE